jgi:demethylmenaquinone methyltransferase/2-methoxy-6-polyprenyl-1,4-benzoquinol methylase
VTIWTEVEEALANIIDDYEKVNHVISAFQDERSRLIGLHKVGYTQGNVLELGSGPGNYSRLVENFIEGPLICLDYLAEMHKTARKKNRHFGHNYIRGVFEAIPIRKSSMNFVTAAYAIRDSLNKPLAISEACKTLRNKGKILIIDIGKPDNPIIRGFMSIFMRFFVPILGGIIAGYGYRNPWNTLYLTFTELPTNNKLVSLINKHVRIIERIEKILGALVIIIGEN